MSELVIDDHNYREHCEGGMQGGRCGTVAQPRQSVGMRPFHWDLIPRHEWSERIGIMERQRSRLSDLCKLGDAGRPIPHLDQNGQGYCWAYSTASAIMAARARDAQPYKRLSAHAVACKIKNFRDQGGWNPLSVEFGQQRGYPTVDTWPEKSMSRSNDRAEVWEEAKRYRILDGHMQLNAAVWDRNLTFDQLFTCLLLRVPCPVDFMWWRHSVCALDPVELDAALPLSDPNRWGVRVWNSWRGWGENSMGVLRGRKAIPDGATAITVVTG